MNQYCTLSYCTILYIYVHYLVVTAFFLLSFAQLGDWVCEKMLMARDSSRDETQKLHKKWLKHQAFMAELAQNKEWLDKIERVSLKCLLFWCFHFSCMSICRVLWCYTSFMIS